MENPGSWDDTQKLINQALYVNPTNPGPDVVKALGEASLLKVTDPDRLKEIEVVITEEAQRVHQMVMTGYCGRSACGVIYSKLQTLGVV